MGCTTLSTRYRSEKDAAIALNQFPIIHVHGTLGGFLPLQEIGRHYSPDLSADAIRIAAENIIVVGEASGETSEFEEVRKLLQDAKRIIFLGFSYHPESIRRLGIFNKPWTVDMRDEVRVGGTSRDIPIHVWNHIQANVLNGAFPARNRKVNPVYDYLNVDEPLDEDAL